MKPMLFSNILSIVVCLLLAGLTAAVLLTERTEPGRTLSNTDIEIRTLPVKTKFVKPQSSFEYSRIYKGVTRAKQVVDLGFSRAGTVEKITVDPGDSVKKDKIVAELESGFELKAPFDGVVASRQMSVGSFANPGMPVIRLVEKDNLEAWIGIPVDVAKDMNASDSHTLKVGDEEYLLPLTALLPEVDKNGRTRTVVFAFPEKVSSKHLPGEVVELELTRSSEAPGFWVPTTALTKEARGMWAVYTVVLDENSDHRVDRHKVELIHTEGDRSWVNGTVEGSMRIITDGVQLVVPGQKVLVDSKSKEK